MTAGAVMAYLLQSALFLSIGHLLYKALLSRMKMPAFNRAVILTIYIFSLVAPSFHSMKPSWPSATSLENIPLITDDSYLISLNTSPATMPQTIQTATTYPDDVAPEPQNHFQIAATHSSSGSTFPWQALCVTACIGAAIGLLHLLLSLATIVWIGLRSESRNLGHVRLLLLDNERISPFSLLNMIFMPRSDWNNGSDMIIAHEMGHIRHLHSIDLLISRGCLILMWWNPSAWLLNRELRAIHEYQADDQVLRNGHEIRDYQLLLIKKAADTRLQSVASSLNHSKLKQRFTMMYQKNPSSWIKVRAIALVPAFCGVMLLTGQHSFASLINEIAQTSLFSETIQPTTAYASDGTSPGDRKVTQTDASTQITPSAETGPTDNPIETTSMTSDTENDGHQRDEKSPTETAPESKPVIVISEPDFGNDDSQKSVWELDVLKSKPSFIDAKIYDKAAGAPTINGVKVTLDQMDEFLRDNNETKHLQQFREMRRAGKFNNGTVSSDLHRDTFIRTDDDNDDSVITVINGASDQTVYVTRDGHVTREIDKRTKDGVRKLAQEAREKAQEARKQASTARDKASEQRRDAMEQATDARIQAIETQAQALEAQAQALESRAQAMNDKKQASSARKQAAKARKEASKARTSAAKERKKIQRLRKERPDWWNFEVFTPEQKEAMDAMSKQLSEMNTTFAEMDASFAEMNKGLAEMSKSLARTRSITVNGHDIEHYPASDGKLTGMFVSLNNTNGTNVEVLLSSATPIEIGSATMHIGGKRYKCSIPRATKITQGNDKDTRYIVLAKIRAKKLTTFSNNDYVTIITNQGTLKIHLKTK